MGYIIYRAIVRACDALKPDFFFRTMKMKLYSYKDISHLYTHKPIMRAHKIRNYNYFFRYVLYLNRFVFCNKIKISCVVFMAFFIRWNFFFSHISIISDDFDFIAVLFFIVVHCSHKKANIHTCTENRYQVGQSQFHVLDTLLCT